MLGPARGGSVSRQLSPSPPAVLIVVQQLILEAISEVVDLGVLERQIRAAATSRNQGSFTFDSVLAVLGGREE
jgi:hypothetical protein